MSETETKLVPCTVAQAQLVAAAIRARDEADRILSERVNILAAGAVPPGAQLRAVDTDEGMLTFAVPVVSADA